jgi:superfamily II DNA/RNA helicase
LHFSQRGVSNRGLHNFFLEPAAKAAQNKEDSDEGDDVSESDNDDSGSEQSEDSAVKLGKDEEVNAFRNRMQIKVKGNNPPKPIPTFYSMDMEKDLKNVIISNIEKSDWKEPTPIQMQGIPSLLAGRDVLAAAPTGSGKTAAL